MVHVLVFFFNLSSFFVVKSKILYVVCSNASEHFVFHPQAALLLTFSSSSLLSYKSVFDVSTFYLTGVTESYASFYYFSLFLLFLFLMLAPGFLLGKPPICS